MDISDFYELDLEPAAYNLSSLLCAFKYTLKPGGSEADSEQLRQLCRKQYVQKVGKGNLQPSQTQLFQIASQSSHFNFFFSEYPSPPWSKGFIHLCNSINFKRTLIQTLPIQLGNCSWSTEMLLILFRNRKVILKRQKKTQQLQILLIYLRE